MPKLIPPVKIEMIGMQYNRCRNPAYKYFYGEFLYALKSIAPRIT